MKILIVDDSEERIKLIKATLSSLDRSKFLEVKDCKSADLARRELVTRYDLLILDVLLPKKLGGTAQALHSVKLLADVCDPRSRFIRPGLIVGITADVAELGVYQNEFAVQATIVLEGTNADLSWLDRLVDQVESLLGSTQKIGNQSKDRVVISVHGIRTYGHWQDNLGSLVESYSRHCDRVEIKFGFFNVFFFLIPFLRKLVLKRVSARISQNMREHEDKEVYLVAHSFGTVAVHEALRSRVCGKKLKGIILCGSPLPADLNIDHIVRNSEVTYNECGTRDFVLVMARLFGWGLGDAGRIGFLRENTSTFRNRYFKGGHGLYFDKDENGVFFYERQWLPLLIFGTPLSSQDSRSSYFGQDLVDLLLNAGAFLKPVFYLLAPIAVFVISLFRIRFRV